MEAKWAEYSVIRSRKSALQHCVSELLLAEQYAEVSRRQPAEFAVELSVLRLGGVSNSDLRWLLSEALVEHFNESSTPSNGKQNATRLISAAANNRISESSCFLLTDSGKDFAKWLLHDADQENLLPCWNASERLLTVGESVVKCFRCPALNQETILSAFEESGWSKHIFDPLPPHPMQDSKRRLNETIKSLNKNQAHDFIRFHGDGTGEGIVWEFHKRIS